MQRHKSYYYYYSFCLLLLETPWLKEQIPGCCTQLSQTGEGVNGLASFPLLSANSELLHGAELLQLIGEGTHLLLQGIDGAR